jgi:hypothetical protein
MDNLNRYTKDQLVQKLKDQNIDSKSAGVRLLNIFKESIQLLKNFKDLIFKITLITFAIKIFKKFSILRKIWRIFTSIVMSIFGISLFDIHDQEIISNIVGYIRSSNFYKLISDIFSYKIEKIEKIENINVNSPSRELRENNNSTTKIEKSAENLRWSYKEINLQENSKPFYEDRKFIAISAMLILGVLSWFFWADVKPFLTFINSKPNPRDGLSPHNPPISPVERISSSDYNWYFRERNFIETNQDLFDLDDIILEDKTKRVDYSEINLELENWSNSSTPKAKILEVQEVSKEPALIIPLKRD